jgi:hypothetical protein
MGDGMRVPRRYGPARVRGPAQPEVGRGRLVRAEFVRDIWYVTLVHFTGPVVDPAGLVDWVVARRTLNLRETLVVQSVCRSPAAPPTAPAPGRPCPRRRPRAPPASPSRRRPRRTALRRLDQFVDGGPTAAHVRRAPRTGARLGVPLDVPAELAALPLGRPHAGPRRRAVETCGVHGHPAPHTLHAHGEALGHVAVVGVLLADRHLAAGARAAQQVIARSPGWRAVQSSSRTRGVFPVPRGGVEMRCGRPRTRGGPPPPRCGRVAEGRPGTRGVFSGRGGDARRARHRRCGGSPTPCWPRPGSQPDQFTVIPSIARVAFADARRSTSARISAATRGRPGRGCG